jgi:uncharacterized membrane protein YraQ (UPF0718 family)
MQLDLPTMLRRFATWSVLLIVIGLLVLAVLGTGRDAGMIISIFSTRFLGIFIEAAPFLLLGTLVSGLLEAFIKPEDIARWTPRNPVLATISGAFMGFVFPVCECGVVPVVRRLFHKGLPMSVGVTFLLAAPVMNPIVLASTFIAFGPGPIFYGRFIISALVATTVGLVFALGARPQEVLHPHSMAPVMGGAGEALPTTGAVSAGVQRPTVFAGLRQALYMAGDEFFEMGRFLIIGSLLAASMQTLVSQEVLLALGEGPVVSVLVMQVFAFVLSVCSTVDAFLALAFVGTFTTGSVLAFLTFGPMVDIKSTLMFLGVFQRRVVLYLIALPLLLTLLIGIWMNLNLAL